jgi:hypothetical protein
LSLRFRAPQSCRALAANGCARVIAFRTDHAAALAIRASFLTGDDRLARGKTFSFGAVDTRRWAARSGGSFGSYQLYHYRDDLRVIWKRTTF